jgi:hypothetical protein
VEEIRMSRSPRRLISLLLLLAYLPQITSCYKTLKVEPSGVEPGGTEPVAGVTQIGGKQVRFEAAGSLDRDSVHGQVGGEAVAISLDSVDKVWVTRGRDLRWIRPSEVREVGERVIGATMTDGTDVRFDSLGGYVRSDTVFAMQKGEPVRLPLNQVQRLWLRKTDSGKTALAVIGVSLLASVALAAATKESCPFVYSWDGTRYVFDAEPYGGAISRGLERDDYARLENLRPEGGLYKLLVTNEVNETQMTNMMELWIVDHAPGARVLPDLQGGLHVVGGAIPPASAVDRQGRDLRPWLEATDRTIWESIAVADADGGMRDEIVLTFPKPAEAKSARLITNVATGIWGSHMIRAMLELRGREVGAWYARVDGGTHSRDSLLAWDLREELYHLRIEVREPEGWKTRAVLPGGGPFISEDRLLPLDLSRVVGDTVRLRIRPPRGFWALNSFALDFGEARPAAVDTLRPVTAKDARWGDMLSALSTSDDSYYAMPYTGDYGHLTFNASPPPRPGLTRTVLLHTRGYYRLHLPIGAGPDKATLDRLSFVPNAAAQFAAEQFAKWQMANK